IRRREHAHSNRKRLSHVRSASESGTNVPVRATLPLPQHLRKTDSADHRPLQDGEMNDETLSNDIRFSRRLLLETAAGVSAASALACAFGRQSYAQSAQAPPPVRYAGV